MKIDPIVDEIRKAGNKLCESNGNDLHSVCEFLRKRESSHKDKLVSSAPRKRIKANVVSDSRREYNIDDE